MADAAAELQEIVDAAADLLRAPATLEDRDFHLVAHASHGDGLEIDRVRRETILRKAATAEVRRRFERFGIAGAAGPVRIPGDPEQGVLGRLCLPVRWNSVVLGYLWLLDDGRGTDGGRDADGGPAGGGGPVARGGGAIPDAEVRRAGPLVERAGVLMARQARSREDLGLRLDDLLSPEAAVRERAVDEVDEAGVVGRDAPVGVAVLRAAGGAGAGGPVALLNPWRLPRSVLATTVGAGERDTVLVVPLGTGAADPVDRLRAVAARARALIAERLPEGERGVAVGLFGPCGGLARVREGWLRARVAARAAVAAGDGEPREWGRLGAERLLWSAPDTRLAEAALGPGPSALLAPGRAELARTARVFLDAAGSVKTTAELLNVHRQTLYHRLRRIEQLTGLAVLTDGRDRLTLHLGLVLAPHVAGAPDDTGPVS